MLRIRVTTAEATILETELITAGRRGLQCAFAFSDDWEGLAKTVIVRGVVKRDIVLVGDTITVPGECLEREQFPLHIGVYGANGEGEIVIPTIWADFGKIRPSARPSGVSPDEVTPDVVAQIQQNSSDALHLAQLLTQRADAGEFNGRDGATGPQGAVGADGANGNSLWTTTEEPMPTSGGEAFTHLTGRSNVPPIVGDIIVRSSRYVYQIVETLSGGTAIGYQIGDIKGETGATGPQGPAGPGVPAGGTVRQVLFKGFGGDYVTFWGDIPKQVAFFDFTVDGNEAEGPDFSVVENALHLGIASFAKVDFDGANVYLPCTFYESAVAGHTFKIQFSAVVADSALYITITSGSTENTWTYYAWNITEEIGNSLTKDQGIDNAGKFLVVGADGNVTPQDAAGGAVLSVNGETGNVLLDASDVGAYEKPATGIPASDLASGVIPANMVLYDDSGSGTSAAETIPLVDTNGVTWYLGVDTSGVPFVGDTNNQVVWVPTQSSYASGDEVSY